jgi:hypothetical protein
MILSRTNTALAGPSPQPWRGAEPSSSLANVPPAAESQQGSESKFSWPELRVTD